MLLSFGQIVSLRFVAFNVTCFESVWQFGWCLLSLIFIIFSSQRFDNTRQLMTLQSVSQSGSAKAAFKKTQLEELANHHFSTVTHQTECFTYQFGVFHISIWKQPIYNTGKAPTKDPRRGNWRIVLSVTCKWTSQTSDADWSGHIWTSWKRWSREILDLSNMTAWKGCYFSRLGCSRLIP